MFYDKSKSDELSDSGYQYTIHNTMQSFFAAGTNCLIGCAFAASGVFLACHLTVYLTDYEFEVRNQKLRLQHIICNLRKMWHI
jgi:hypothetical protein